MDNNTIKALQETAKRSGSENEKLIAKKLLERLQTKMKEKCKNIPHTEYDLKEAAAIFKPRYEMKYNADTYTLELTSFKTNKKDFTDLFFHIILGVDDYNNKFILTCNMYKNNEFIYKADIDLWGRIGSYLCDDISFGWWEQPIEHEPMELNQKFRNLLLNTWNEYWTKTFDALNNIDLKQLKGEI